MRMKEFSYSLIPFAIRSMGCLCCLRSELPTGKEREMAIRSMAARWVVVAFLATLATLALAAVTLAQPAEAAPRMATLAVADDDDGRDDDNGARGDDDGARGDDDGTSAARTSGGGDDDGGARGGDDDGGARGDDDAKGGVREVPAGGVETGAGGTAAASDGALPGWGVGSLMAGGVLLVGAVAALLRRVTGGVGS
jgi:hypothetical protein